MELLYAWGLWPRLSADEVATKMSRGFETVECTADIKEWDYVCAPHWPTGKEPRFRNMYLVMGSPFGIGSSAHVPLQPVDQIPSRDELMNKSKGSR